VDIDLTIIRVGITKLNGDKILIKNSMLSVNQLELVTE
jgi:hypothetical protein